MQSGTRLVDSAWHVLASVPSARTKARPRAVLEARRVLINNRMVTIRLEWVVWEALDAICKTEDVDVAWIVRNYIMGTNLGTQLARGLRVFAISYLVGFSLDRMGSHGQTMRPIALPDISHAKRDDAMMALGAIKRRRTRSS